ncbi:hypothetical protein C2E23DRAFT_753776 [Lenzites betulinus]|nr:hypothetical protein C2E23DRAFT_753776 [Lenzites betulinus]
MADVLDEVFAAAVLAYRQFVPPLEDREQLTWSSYLQAHLYLIPYLFLAYLVRRQGTRLIRLMLLPTVVPMALRCMYRYKIEDPRLVWLEWSRGLLGWFVIAKSLDFAFAKDGRLKVGEKDLGGIGEPTPSRKKGSEQAAALLGRNPAARILPRSIFDALEVGMTLRGIGWDFGRYTPVPPNTRPLERQAYIRATVKTIICNQLLADLIDTVTKSIPGITNTGGTIFLQDIPSPQRYAVSTAIHLGHGLLISCSVACVYDYVSLVGVILLNQPVSQWPPIHGNLFRARSLHQFWSKSWHQSLRYTFLTLGGFPGKWLAGGLGMVFGSFFASALFHELALAVAGKELHINVFAFFLLQAVGIVLEKAFQALTGRKVGGILGFAWTAIFVLGIGQICTDAWFARGIGGAISIPPFMSPIRMIVLPLIRIAVRYSGLL